MRPANETKYQVWPIRTAFSVTGSLLASTLLLFFTGSRSPFLRTVSAWIGMATTFLRVAVVIFAAFSQGHVFWNCKPGATLRSGRVAVRGSGTEPKIKFYLFARHVPEPGKSFTADQLAKVKTEVKQRLGAAWAWLQADADARLK